MSALQVAVVGAGPAGLAVAAALAAGGARALVFDKGRSAGGRVATRRAGNLQFDHGAQFFTVRDPRFRARIEPLLASGQVAEWTGPFRGWRDGKPAPDPKPGQRRYVGTPSMSALPRALATGLAVECGLRIENVQPVGCGDRKAWLHGAAVDGGASDRFGPFDEVILALPPAQALALLPDGMAASPVVRAARALSNGLSPCIAAMVELDAEVVEAAGGLFVTDPVLAFAAHDGGKPGRDGRPTYVLHATAAWSFANLEADPHAAATELVAAFARVLAVRLPDVVSLIGHRWRHALAEERAQTPPFARDARAGLTLVGDAFTGGRIEGAWCSGVEAAAAVLADHRGHDQGTMPAWPVS